MKTEFGKWMKRWRTSRGYTVREFAQMTALTPTRVFNMEAGATVPDIFEFYAIAQALGRNPGHLLNSLGKQTAETVGV